MATTTDANNKAWFLRDSETTTTTVVRYESIPEKKKKKKKKKREEDDERKKRQQQQQQQQQQQRSLARRAAEKQRSMMMMLEEEEQKRETLRGNAFDDTNNASKEEEEKENEKTLKMSSSMSSSRTLRAYASENAQLREALRKSLSRANRLETELEETTKSLSSCEGALKDARISHRALQSESKERRKRDRDALNSLRKTLEERERISRGERARCGRALRYAMDCLRAHAPLAEDERNEGGSVLGSVVAELARLTEIATSAGDVGFRAYVEGSGGVKTRTEGEDDDDDEAAFLERQADAMRKAKTKITQLEDERKRLLQTLEDATNPRKEYITNEEEEEEEERNSFFSSKPTARDEYLFDQDASRSASANARNFFRKTRSAADAEESNEDLAFALPGADALARDIDALDSELKKLASAFERER
jgi:hypothetical protein